MLTKELEILIKSVITDNGFKYKKEIKGFSWTRRHQDRREEIVIGYRTFYPNMFQIYSPSVYLYFDEVETILKECLEKNNVKNIWGLPRTIQSVLRNIEGVDYSKFETKIHDEASFQIVAEEIKKIVRYGAMPFFERYQMLENVFKATEKMPLEQMANFIGQPLPQRRMIIKKLCNDPNYNEYVNWLIEYYKSENDPDLFIIEKLNEFLNKEFG